MNSSTDSDSSSEDEVEKARLAEACVSNDYFKGPKKAQKSINGKKPLDLNSSSASDIKVQKSKFNGSQFNDDIPEKFDEIISKKIGQYLLEKYSYTYNQPEVNPDYLKNHKKRLKYGIRMLENGEKVGLKQESTSNLDIEQPKVKRKSASEQLQTSLKKKRGKIESDDLSACIVSFDFNKNTIQ